MTFAKCVYRDGDRVRVFRGEVIVEGVWVIIRRPGWPDVRLNERVVEAIIPEQEQDERQSR